MIPLDEFYSFSDVKRRKLVDRGHVVLGGKLATEVPPRSRNDCYVFEEPVINQVVETLKRGKYKTREIEPEFPLDREALDDLLGELRYNRFQTLADHKAVVRAAGKDGAANIYTVDPLPFESRTLDPTLSGHLLIAGGVFSAEFPEAQEIASSDAFSEYANRVEDFWGLPKVDLKQEIDPETTFVTSAIGPLPKITAFPKAESVRDRTLDVEAAYVHKQYSPRKVHHGISFRKSRVRRNPSLPAFQEFSSYLADVYRYGTFENDRQLLELSARGAKVYFRCLYGNYRPDDSASWQPFQVRSINDDLSEIDRQVLDVVELQPTKNSELADKWGYDDSSRVSGYIRNDFNQFATRNKDMFICATESARRRVEKLIQDGTVETSTPPPAIPVPAKTPIEEPQDHSSSKSDQSNISEASNGSGTNWNRQRD